MLISEILKWIGIVLLYLLLFVLIVLLLVLFLPIKYTGEGTYNSEKQYALIKIRWFWGLVRVKAAYPDEPYLSVKLLWIELIKPDKENDAPKKEKSMQDTAEPVEDKGVTPKEGTPHQRNFENSKEQEKESTPPKEKSAAATEKITRDKEPFYEKWIGIRDKIQYYIAILKEQDTKDLLAHCKIRIIKILKSIRPRKITFQGTVGFATPDTTGYLYGVYCIMSSYLGENVILIPDFEKEIIDVTGSLKGRITIFVLAWNALQIYLDKRLMRLISKLKKGGR